MIQHAGASAARGSAVGRAHRVRGVRVLFGVLISSAVLVSACDSNPYDPSQKPVVAVTAIGASSQLQITWQPAGAQLVRVYRGAVAGDGYGANLMWSIAATGNNTLASGVSYGEATPAGGSTDFPARPLIAGERYTAEVTRRDPKGKGDGFTNTSNRYVGTVTFTYSPP